MGRMIHSLLSCFIRCVPPRSTIFFYPLCSFSFCSQAETLSLPLFPISLRFLLRGQLEWLPPFHFARPWSTISFRSPFSRENFSVWCCWSPRFPPLVILPHMIGRIQLRGFLCVFRLLCYPGPLRAFCPLSHSDSPCWFWLYLFCYLFMFPPVSSNLRTNSRSVMWSEPPYRSTSTLLLGSWESAIPARTFFLGGWWFLSIHILPRVKKTSTFFPLLLLGTCHRQFLFLTPPDAQHKTAGWPRSESVFFVCSVLFPLLIASFHNSNE